MATELPADDRAQSRANWDRVAAGWERYVDKMWAATELVSRHLVDGLALRPGETVLELAAGVGRTGLLAAAAVAPGGSVIVTDFSPEMVDAARRQAQRFGVANVEHRTMDAEAIELPDESVDAVLCRWGVMLVPEPARALAECRRVLRPAGRLAFSVWADADANPWATVPGRPFIRAGVFPPPEPDEPGPFRLADPARLEQLTRGAGFETVAIEDVPVELPSDDFDDFWGETQALSARVSGALAGLPPEERERMRVEVEREAEPYRVNGGYRMPGLCRNVLAR